MKSLHEFLIAHWDHEPSRYVAQPFQAAGSTGFPARRSIGRLESRPNPQAGKPALLLGSWRGMGRGGSWKAQIWRGPTVLRTECAFAYTEPGLQRRFSQKTRLNWRASDSVQQPISYHEDHRRD